MCLGVRGAPVETAVDELMNGLVAYGRPVSIVLDDLHTVASERSLRSIAHAIERLPANARVLASTRSDPAISLARLRARGALVEIRAGELAFTVDEARELILREGIELSEESVELLVERTEGWPAGLYLAALWLRDLEDPDQGVRSFVGSTRHVADYLTDEVLTALAPQTRDFLLRTSVLGRFTPDLCDAVLEPRGLGRSARGARALEHVPGRPGRERRVVPLSPSVRRASAAGARGRGTRRCCVAARRLGVARTGLSRMRSSTPPPLGTLRRWPSCWSRTTSSSSGVGGSDSFSAGCAGFPRAAARTPLAAGTRSDRRGVARAPGGRDSSGCLRWRSGRAGSGRSCGRHMSRRSRRSHVRRRSSAVTWARPSSTLAARSRPLARARTSSASASSRACRRPCSSPASSTRRGGSRCRPSSDPTRRTSPTATSAASGCSP